MTKIALAVFLANEATKASIQAAQMKIMEECKKDMGVFSKKTAFYHDSASYRTGAFNAYCSSLYALVGTSNKKLSFRIETVSAWFLRANGNRYPYEYQKVTLLVNGEEVKEEDING